MLLAIPLLIAISCRKKDPAKDPEPSPLPELSTLGINFITDTTAIAGGTITSQGSSTLESAGICWDTLTAPTINSKKVYSKITGVGTYTLKLTALKPNYKYYVRAFASNANGIVYGNEVSFSTPSIWSRLDSSALDNYVVNCFAADGELIYAGTSKGVYYSSNEGGSWNAAGLDSLNISVLTVKEGIVFAANYNSIFRSENTGTSWKKISSNFPVSLVSVGDMAASGSNLLVATFQGVFWSNNNGDNWQASGTALPASRFYSNLAVSEQALYVASSGLNNSGPDIHRSDDGGTTWTSAGIPPQVQTINIVDIAANGNNVMISTSNAAGAYISGNSGATWQLSTELPVSTNKFIMNGQNGFCYTVDGNYYSSVNGGGNWSLFSKKGIKNGTPQAAVYTGNYIYVALLGDGIYKRRR